MRAVNHCVCFASNPAFGHLALCLMCRWGQIAERRLQTLSFRRCRVCEPGLDMCCQRAVTSDLSPNTLTQPSPILFTPSIHMPLCPVHWPDGCLIKDGGIYSGQTTNITPNCSLISDIIILMLFIQDPVVVRGHTAKRCKFYGDLNFEFKSLAALCWTLRVIIQMLTCWLAWKSSRKRIGIAKTCFFKAKVK